MTENAPNSRFEHVYAVLRWDEGIQQLRDAVTVTKVFRTEDDAIQEVARLNAANAAKGCRYFSQVTRLVQG